jgi:hypothetical protein
LSKIQAILAPLLTRAEYQDPILSILLFDEQFTNLQNRGFPISLQKSYNQSVNLTGMCFVSGVEICLIERSGRVRVFNLVTHQFRCVILSMALQMIQYLDDCMVDRPTRPTDLQIEHPIANSFPSPDGSCLLITVADIESLPRSDRLLAFYWGSFGSEKKGIDLTALPPSDAYRVATRFEGKGGTHIISFSAGPKILSSTVIQAKRKAIEHSPPLDREYYQQVAASLSLGKEYDELRAEMESMTAKRDKIKSERDQLRLERDLAREDSERYRAERDKAIEQQEAAAVKCRALRMEIKRQEAEAMRCQELTEEVERLKKMLKEKDENSNQILKLTIESLQNLRGSLSG